MMYQQYKPDIALQDYIDAYWINKSNSQQTITQTILPDGCVDIIINLGADCSSDNDKVVLQNERAYLVGTMTRFNKTTMNPDSFLLGIRFKPAAFSCFYKFASLHEVRDNLIEFDQSLLPDLQNLILNSTTCLNQFFLEKLDKPKHNLFRVIADIQHYKGQVAVPDLAQRHFITARQLERNFKQLIGISPKEFIRLVRYQSVMKTIQNKTSNQSLMDIAFEHGYYDHSHLVHDIKSYTGITPSRF